MDMEFLKGNLKAAIRKMPPDLQLDFSKLFTVVEKHMATLEKIGPEVWDLLSNDVMTCAMEFMSGTVNKDGLSKVVHEAFAECGIGLPDAPKPQG